jgi:hypothetical protein
VRHYVFLHAIGSDWKLLEKIDRNGVGEHNKPAKRRYKIEMHGLYLALLLNFVNTLYGILRETLGFLVLSAVVM